MAYLTLDALSQAVRNAVAIRSVNVLQPAAGVGAKVFPSTYGPSQDKRDRENYGDTKYATEKRLVDGKKVDCVLLDSVASQANRMEEALRDAWEDDGLTFPLIRVDFSDADLPDTVGTITTLDAPHRVYDAILRDAVDADGVLFRYTEAGQRVTSASVRDATALYHYCPTALVFGAWDSTGPKGGLGAKFPRAVSSEIVAIDAQLGIRVQSRIDPLQITKVMGVVYKEEGSPDWSNEPATKKSKSIEPSKVVHGNVTPSRDRTNGGITFDHARQTTVLSLPALRRLRFPTRVDGAPHDDRTAAEHAARTALAALAVAGFAQAHARGYDLRSGTLLVGTGPVALEVVDAEGGATAYTIDAATAASLVAAAVARAATLGMGWEREPIPTLAPAPKLLHLLRESQRQQALKGVDADEET